MAHAIFNVSPVKFLSSIQDHVFTATPTLKNKLYTNKSDKRKSFQQQQDNQQRNSSASPVTLQLTLPTDSASIMDLELQQQQQPTSSTVPIDIPRSYPLNVPMNNSSNNNYSRSGMDYEGLMMPNNLLSESYNSHHSYENNLISLANSVTQQQSPYLLAEDLTVCFDGLAVRSPTGSFYSNGGLYSPRQINSPINIGSPHSPIYNFNSGCSPPPNYNFLAGSPVIDTTTFQQQQELSNSYGFTYLSPSLQPQHHHQSFSPLNSPSPTGSYVNNSSSLFPPNNTIRPTSPVPEDVILTASEVNDYINSPYSAATPSSSVIVQPLTADDITNDMDLFSNNNSIVTHFAPHTTTQPQLPFNAGLFFSEDDAEDDDGIDGEEITTVNKHRKVGTAVNTTTPSGRRAKIHKCPYCDHTSNRANNMREHTLIHNPHRPKPHACKLCNRAFARKHDMNRHYISCKKQHSKNSGGVYVMTSPTT